MLPPKIIVATGQTLPGLKEYVQGNPRIHTIILIGEGRKYDPAVH